MTVKTITIRIANDGNTYHLSTFPGIDEREFQTAFSCALPQAQPSVRREADTVVHLARHYGYRVEWEIAETCFIPGLDLAPADPNGDVVILDGVEYPATDEARIWYVLYCGRRLSIVPERIATRWPESTIVAEIENETEAFVIAFRQWADNGIDDTTERYNDWKPFIARLKEIGSLRCWQPTFL